jgi:hypothetical protein
MSKRKSTDTAQETNSPADGEVVTMTAEPPKANATATETSAQTASAEAPSFAAVPAPEKRGPAYTIDNRVGYRKEDTEDGHSRQIRFGDRVGGQRPDDELLAPVREEKPMVRFSPREKAWGENKTPDTLEALDRADHTLAEIGRKRRTGYER